MTVKELMERVRYAREQAAYWGGRADAYLEMLETETRGKSIDESNAALDSEQTGRPPRENSTDGSGTQGLGKEAGHGM